MLRRGGEREKERASEREREISTHKPIVGLSALPIVAMHFDTWAKATSRIAVDKRSQIVKQQSRERDRKKERGERERQREMPTHIKMG